MDEPRYHCTIKYTDRGADASVEVGEVVTVHEVTREVAGGGREPGVFVSIDHAV